MTIKPMLRPMLCLASLLLTGSTWARGQSCTDASCADDPWPLGAPGLLGNEQLEWNSLSGGGPVGWFEVLQRISGGLPTVCLTAPSTATRVVVSGTACVDPRDTVLLSVRACNRVNPSDPGSKVQCGNEAAPVGFLPHLCAERGHEIPCYAGAPCRLPPSDPHACR